MVTFDPPNGLPFSFCVPTGYDKYTCIKASDAEFGQRKTCYRSKYYSGWIGRYKTPPLVVTSINYAEKKILNGNVVAKFSVWVGVETDLSAIWVGGVGPCARFPIDPPSVSPTIDPSNIPLEDLQEVMDDAQSYASNALEYFRDYLEDTPLVVRVFFEALIVVIVLLIMITYAVYVGASGGVGA
jgi:hypothetical protein